jgi:hypothetical protein
MKPVDPNKPVLFHTHADTPLQILRLVTGDDKFKSVWVLAHPGEKTKEIETHIDISAIKEGEDAVLKYLASLPAVQPGVQPATQADRLA